MSTIGTCPHTLTFWDVDEIKCRTCGASLTFPARPPSADDEATRRQAAVIDTGLLRLGRPRTSVVLPERERLDARCVVCRSKAWDTADSGGDSRCEGCEAVVAVKVAAGWQLPPLKPFPKLVCSCCRESLPVLAYSYQKKASNGHRNTMCRQCRAVRARVRRETHCEESRAALGPGPQKSVSGGPLACSRRSK